MTAHAIGALAGVWDGDLLAVEAGGVKLVIARVGDAVHAFRDRCAHLGVALSQGALQGTILTCHAHHWQYDVATGQGVNPRAACLHRYPVRITDGVIYVELDDGRA